MKWCAEGLQGKSVIDSFVSSEKVKIEFFLNSIWLKQMIKPVMLRSFSKNTSRLSYELDGLALSK